ncbi:hypothetical protein HFN89_00285 [Rhizobium laguerreae]|nr:hypothetical protein [Rhizobium laguerreae]
MTENFDLPYSLVDGDLFHTDSKGNRKRVCHRGGRIALSYDAEDGILHHHGENNDVVHWFDETRKRLVRSESTLDLAAALKLVSMPLVEECIREVNRCIAVTGSVMGIEKRLSVLYGLGPAGAAAFSEAGPNHDSVWNPMGPTTA